MSNYQQDAQANIDSVARAMREISERSMNYGQAHAAYAAQQVVAQIATVQAILALDDTLRAILPSSTGKHESKNRKV